MKREMDESLFSVHLIRGIMIVLDIDCAAICRLAARIMSRESESAAALCEEMHRSMMGGMKDMSR